MKKTKNKKGVYCGVEIKGARAHRLKALKQKAGDGLDEPVLDKFIDDDTKINTDDAVVTHPSDWDIRDEVSQMDAFRDYQQESRGNGLTYGDY